MISLIDRVVSPPPAYINYRVIRFHGPLQLDAKWLVEH